MRTSRWKFKWKRWGVLMVGFLLLTSWLVWPLLSQKLIETLMRSKIEALGLSETARSVLPRISMDYHPQASVFEAVWNLATADSESGVVRDAASLEFMYWINFEWPRSKTYESEDWERAFVNFLGQKRKQTLSPRGETLLSAIDEARAKKQTENEEDEKFESLYRTSAPAVESEDAYLKLTAKLKELEYNAPEDAIVELLGAPSFRFESRGGYEVYYVYLRPKPSSSIAGLPLDDAGFQLLVVDGILHLVRNLNASEVSP